MSAEILSGLIRLAANLNGAAGSTRFVPFLVYSVGGQNDRLIIEAYVTDCEARWDLSKPFRSMSFGMDTGRSIFCRHSEERWHVRRSLRPCELCRCRAPKPHAPDTSRGLLPRSASKWKSSWRKLWQLCHFEPDVHARHL